MGYQSRRRGYKSRREQRARTRRNTLIVLAFLAVAFVVYGIMRRADWWNYLRTYFM